MNCLLDMTPLACGSAGVSIYTDNLYKYLNILGPQDSFYPVIPPWKFNRSNTAIKKIDTALTDIVWRPFLLPFASAKVRPDLIHFTSPRPFFDFFYNFPFLVTVNDIYGLENPGVLSKWEKHLYSGLGNFLKRSSGVFTISHFTMSCVLNKFPHLDPSKFYPIHLGYNKKIYHTAHDPAGFENLKLKYKLEKPFFLFVSTLEPRKNILFALDAFIASGLSETMDFILIGSDGWVPNYMHEIFYRQNKCPSIRRIGFIPFSDLPLFYALACAFVFPSLYEGFGLPVVEAMASGCPVICSTGSSLDEIASGSAIQIPTDDFDFWVDALKKIASDPKIKEELAFKGIQRASCFSWEKCAKETLEIYHRL